jgi:hypothetical protein
MTWAPDPESDSTTIIGGFLAGRRRLADPLDAIEILCALQSEVAHAGVTTFPDASADCFCGVVNARYPGWRFENSGEVIRWIVETVRTRLTAEGRMEAYR